MTPPTAMSEPKTKRKYRKRQVYAKPCPECESPETRVDGRYHSTRYCVCDACGHRWSQLPKSSQLN